MTYQQAGRIAIIKRILGWLVFIPALLSTLISLLNFIYQHSEKTKGINAVMLDFVHVMVDMVRFNTPFLNLFWYNSPVPNLDKSLFSGGNLMFILIYFLIFVGLALCASGARMSRQVRFIRERLEDQLILEQAKGSEGLTRVQLEQRITLPHHTIFLQYFPLYILPIVIAVVAYFVIKLLGSLAGGA
ncbi:YniB family protein [Serratia sp. AKBS12]|uniref:YniB family protein n=1 Tax=Serratia sp. AKBS12 TaxID=2974597 RepID=UPI002165C2B5|nr:YniB family protein [Serratia sp. AKBS12]MCS3408938.1 YniB family protein [Serratia sp. AKBS12]HEI8865265.1 YniB family protein [Serratia odorifera]